MGQVNNIPINVNLRKNTNPNSPANGKYYFETDNSKTLSTRGLLEHIMSHGLGYPRSIVQGCLTQIAECLTELILQGQPVKLDGFGTFKLTCINEKGLTEAEVLAGVNPADHIEGLRLVVIPDNTDLDKLTSRANLAKASLNFGGIVESVTVGQTSGGKTVKSTDYTPYAVWKAAKQNPNP